MKRKSHNLFDRIGRLEKRFDSFYSTFYASNVRRTKTAQNKYRVSMRRMDNFVRLFETHTWRRLGLILAKMEKGRILFTLSLEEYKTLLLLIKERRYHGTIR